MLGSETNFNYLYCDLFRSESAPKAGYPQGLLKFIKSGNISYS